MFMSKDLRSIGLDPASLYPKVATRPPPLSASHARLQLVPKDSSKGLYNAANYDITAFPRIVNGLFTTTSKSEEQHELLDALSPIYDQLELDRSWGVVEHLFITHEVQRDDCDRLEEHRCRNLGKGRVILGQSYRMVKVHRSVKIRMAAQREDGTLYVPNASIETALALGNVEWID